MKKGYYIHFEGRESIGVSRKIDMQTEEFRKYFTMEEVDVKSVPRSLPERVIGLFPTLSIKRDYSEALQKISDPDFLYVRRTVADRAYVEFWKQIKERYPNCKIIIEIFTYPYDKDNFAKWNAWPFFLKEKLYRGRLKKYVDRFVTYSNNDPVIFGVPTIITTNGVNVEEIRRVNGNFHAGHINMIAVAFMQRHHGYERIIEGLHQYYSVEKNPEYQVNLSLIGDGPEKAFYQKLVQKYQLEKYVHFYPTMSGRELDDLYDDSDIALASFGMYKIGYYGKAGILKSRECLAKGMLMLSGCEIDVLEDNYPYAQIFPNDKSIVDIARVVSFYRKVTEEEPEKEKLADKIRNYAFDKVSMRATMRPIIDYIGDEA